MGLPVLGVPLTSDRTLACVSEGWSLEIQGCCGLRTLKVYACYYTHLVLVGERGAGFDSFAQANLSWSVHWEPGALGDGCGRALIRWVFYDTRFELALTPRTDCVERSVDFDSFVQTNLSWSMRFETQDLESRF